MALRYALAALLVLLGTATAAGERPLIRELARREVPLSQDYFEHPRVNLAAFDGEALHWIDEPLAAEAGCTPQAVLARPRVVLQRCAASGAPTEQRLVGYDDESVPRWRCPLGGERVISADTTGVLLSSGELIDPNTGEPRPLVKTKPERRLSGPAAWSASGTVYAYDPLAVEGRHAGILRWSPGTDGPTLVIERKGSWFRSAPSVEAMKLDDSERYLLMIERPDWRGPTWIGLAVYELRTGKQIHHQRLDEDCICQGGQIVKGKNGLIGVSYHNVTAGAYVLVTFKLVP